MRDRLTEVDIGLLVALEAMLEERNVSRAAARLGITQPALSNRLTRLRSIFDDQLFVPAAGRGMVATPRASALRPELSDMLARLRAFVGSPTTFDPSTSDRTFVIAAYDNPAAMLAPDLVARLRAKAPRVRLAFVLPDPNGVAEALETGAADLFVGLAKAGSDGLISRTLFDEEFATAQRRGHPRGSGPLTLDAYCAADHLLISSEGGGFSGVVDDALAVLGRERRVAVSIQSYALAPLLLANSDCLCTLPRRFLKRFEAALDLFDPPLPLAHFQLSTLWHPRVKNDAAHRWLREQLFAAAQAQSG